MKNIEIIGDNYFGHWENTRTACRGIIVKDGCILLSYEMNVNAVPGSWLRKPVFWFPLQNACWKWMNSTRTGNTSAVISLGRSLDKRK